MCIPLALEGKDLIGQAKTGTGKTLGFGIPLLARVDKSATVPKSPQAIIIVPTRELCIQVASDLEAASTHLGARVLAVYGGRAYEPQIDALAKGVEVVVGTPGRVIDLANRKDLNLSKVRILVLDEADEMLDMGFLPDVERIVTQLPADRQTMLFSATMPGQIIALARRYMQQPTHIRAAAPGDDNATVDAIEQHVWRTHPLDKVELLARILQAKDRGLVMVFTRTKRRAQSVADELVERGFAAASVHGDLGQGAREQALRAFRSGKVDVLIATDVAARGIDVDGVTHVVNYECTDDEKTYLHRVGRTGRAGASGVAITFVDWADTARWQMINRTLGLAFNEPLETYSTSDHVFTGLGIATTVTGSLPSASRTRAGLGAETLEDVGETGKRKPEGDRNRNSGKDGGRPKDGGRAKDGARAKESSHSKGEREPKKSTEAASKAPRQRRRTRSGGAASGATATPAE
ncbi:MAG: DEAD/DEAH box helicase [Actinobacteria bacterium]|nr:DEAD/DEAH box helicase [Actinomycetota bacterium]